MGPETCIVGELLSRGAERPWPEAGLEETETRHGTQPIDQLRGNQGDQMQNQARKQKRDVYGALLFMGDLQGRRGAQWLTAPGQWWVVVVSRDLIHQLQHGRVELPCLSSLATLQTALTAPQPLRPLQGQSGTLLSGQPTA